MHIPILRRGRPYRSLATQTLTHVATGEAVAEVSLANAGLVAKDLGEGTERRAALGRLPARRLLEIAAEAGELFLEGALPVGGEEQGPEDYVELLSATSGMPRSLCRTNMEKIHLVLTEMETVLAGLTRGLDLKALDRGWVRENGHHLSYLPRGEQLGVVLPSNSPGVHSLWLPAVPLKTPLTLKPGSREPWTPLRIAQALLAAGCPGDAVGFYPSDHAGATEILLKSGRSMLFGDEPTLESWRRDPRVEIHGPGWSKVLLGEDLADAWEEHLELMVTSIAANGGRSCINASSVWVPAHGREVAEALARRLGAIEALPLDHPQASLAAFSDPRIAHRISAMIDQRLAGTGAEDLTAAVRGEERVVTVEGCTYLLPTLIWCPEPDHPLVELELLFPFATVVEVPSPEMPRRLGPTLVATGLTEDPVLARQLLDCRSIDRLNLGPVPTTRVSWDQPHEGNLFEHLYRRRALQGPDLASLTPDGASP